VNQNNRAAEIPTAVSGLTHAAATCLRPFHRRSASLSIPVLPVTD
jgi:hypothetical protein